MGSPVSLASKQPVSRRIHLECSGTRVNHSSKLGKNPCYFSAIFLAAWLSLPNAFASPDAVVVFNEVHYNPHGVSEDGEWIEVFNQMGIKTDLSGWRIDGAGYTFPLGTIIDPGSYLAVYKTPEAGELGPFTGSLSNNGETLKLINLGHRLMDELSYGDHGSWPVEADGSGATLAKRNPYTANKPAAHWTFSEQVGGTPGKANFPDANTPTNHHHDPGVCPRPGLAL